MKSLPGLALTALLVVACMAIPPSATAPTLIPDAETAPPSAGLTPGLDATGAVATRSPIPPATVDPEGLQIEWRQRDRDPGFGFVERLLASAAANGRAVVLANGEEYATRIFSSDNGRAWEESRLPSEWVALDDVVPAGPGFIAVGIDADDSPAAVSYVSSDGREWQRFDVDAPVESWRFGSHVGSRAVMATTLGLLVSDDGQSWRSVETPAGFGRPLELETSGDRIAAFTGSGSGRVDVWMSSDGETWQPSGSLPDSRGFDGAVAVSGPIGWVVIGSSFRRKGTDSVAWFSADGSHWERAAGGSPSAISDVLADETGFVAVGHFYPNAGCVAIPDDAWGTTWTSANGTAWRQMPAEGWHHREVDLLHRFGSTLVGIGIDWDRGDPNGSIWTADLPPLTDEGQVPTPEPTPRRPVGGC